jgi:hypothetical protein
MTLKRLPLADQTFAQIIDFDYLYADKTRYIYELIQEPKGSFFLSRLAVSEKPYCYTPSTSFSQATVIASVGSGLTSQIMPFQDTRSSFTACRLPQKKPTGCGN